jgi:hypothetical protein
MATTPKISTIPTRPNCENKKIYKYFELKNSTLLSLFNLLKFVSAVYFTF